jgi:hypothetical protein
MLVGSVAGSFYGMGRTTLDIDLVVDLSARPSQLVARSVEPEYFIDEAALADAARTGQMVNALIQEGRGFKVDINALRRDEFDRVAFSRRRSDDWEGTAVTVIAPADLVVSKLRWAKESRSERQFSDVQAIMALELFDEHDPDFQHWIERLGLREALEASRSSRYAG